MKVDAILITQKDGSVWAVPIATIANNRAEYYSDEFNGDVARSLNEDTLPLFAEDDYEIHDWAANNMNWTDVQEQAWIHSTAGTLTPEDFQEAWINGEKTIDRTK